ncbi:hypothetical protein AAWM_10399 [Aspergillus awamori]|uniref:Contig An15c0220, genomic contig n=6 Tax=Aspergillus TaxID=5052 RepID=A2R662_ASPNC|nr:uncharacterized protein An15g06770 [Aspergillus niger]XP_026624170.1 hypothetical protein BDQ94DRAFT_147545 [Aspergillus welwitschiae]EHA24882.1 hypothetical protein ASPNIDRAFT_182008 [Aspergillus niger ATCC 1015]RDH22173.1 hypothetical protein M747DRAFT_330074 [Aspergillus niger ATCC 13496]GCB27514.1 hypothetical protein AAWM_10399 [Aspergillus awamori]KAI2817403.1 hypothetical protein CBS115989_6039 [Aspergillus niger]KAI2822026.1 hypothetical protein CBS133816_9425 [Aspergillus niger]|eukprot:XP_001397205.1 hypothetical protein ANI_1_922134 [Aspergillus niger CBS 513.88]
MSTTTTTTALTSTTLIGTLPSMAGAAALVSGKACPTCGQDGFLAAGQSTTDARRRAKDLEGQVNALNLQAMQMAEKLAAYEEEIRRLRAQSSSRNNTSVSSTASTQIDRSQSPTHLQTSPKSQPGRLSTLASFLPSRRPSATSTTQAQTVASPPPPEPVQPATSQEETVELQNALNREQSLRKAAESQLSQASTELEELTAQLFSQANEMVAQERKARARLEERVAVLERRDVEKRARLERLEKAMARVERIRAMVG